MNSKARIIRTIFAVTLIIASAVIFFWEHVSVVIFPRAEYEKPSVEAAATAQVTPAPTPVPTVAPTHSAQPTATPEPSPTPTPAPVVQEKWADLLAVNEDLMGWLTIPETKIDYPVVKSTPEENALVEDGFYYLHHNFDREKDEQGAIFFYPTSDLLENNRSIVIFGHNQRNLRMFGTLKYYNYLWNTSALEQYRKSPLIYFDDLYGEGVYKMFAFLLVDELEPGFFNFLYNSFPTEDVFLDYVNHLSLHSMITTDVDVQEGDRLLMLVSCTSESLLKQGKFIIVGRKVRPGESTEVDVNAAYLNPYAAVPAALQSLWEKKVPQ